VAIKNALSLLLISASDNGAVGSDVSTIYGMILAITPNPDSETEEPSVNRDVGGVKLREISSTISKSLSWGNVTVTKSPIRETIAKALRSFQSDEPGLQIILFNKRTSSAPPVPTSDTQVSSTISKVIVGVPGSLISPSSTSVPVRSAIILGAFSEIVIAPDIEVTSEPVFTRSS